MVMSALSHRQSMAEHLVVWVSLFFLLFYSYGYFFQAPYLGFNWGADGSISELYGHSGNLRAGDRIVRIGDMPWSLFRDNHRQPLVTESAGMVVPLQVERNRELLTIDWTLPGINTNEFLARLASGWWMGYLFWFAGVAVVLQVRPRDQRRSLLIAFMMVTAFWLTLGSGISRRHLWEAAVLFRAILWLCFPLYFHLHWLFPTPLSPLPPVLVILIYGIGIAGALAEWVGILPSFAHLIPFLAGLAISMGLLVVHYLRQAELRYRLRLLVGATLLAFLPVFAINVARAFITIPSAVSGGAVLGLPLIPLAYVYIASWQQRGWLELRVNPLISLYLFVFVLATFFVPVASLVYAVLGVPGESLVVALVAFVAALVISGRGYPRFRRWVERVLLHIPLVPEAVVQAYVEEITVSPDRANLIQTLTTRVLPTLHVREALLCFREPVKERAIWLSIGLGEYILPDSADTSLLEAYSGRYLAPGDRNPLHMAVPWVRLILPLHLGGVLQGFWLFGSRDPDDFYARRELPVFRTLAHQTTLAITNIQRAEELTVLHRANVTRTEQERAALARDLHDEILGNLALLKTGLEPEVITERFEMNYALIKRRIRHLATQLRPAMLTYGLQPALAEYLDAVKERYPQGPTVSLQWSEPPPVRYTDFIELELFRIVQQAVENALLHADANRIEIQATTTPREVILEVRDDGKGWPYHTVPNLHQLAHQHHYGLLGMYERATLIDARLMIDVLRSQGEGVVVRVEWYASEAVL